MALRETQRNRNRKLTAWISGGIFFAIVTWIALFGPMMLPAAQHEALGVFCAAAGGLFGFFFVGNMRFVAQGSHSNWIRIGIQGGGGVAFLAVVLLWWWSDHSFIVKERGAISRQDHGNPGEMEQTVARLEKELRIKNNSFEFLWSQTNHLRIEQPSYRTKILAQRIPSDANDYALALVATSEQRFKDAQQHLEIAATKNEIERSKIYVARLRIEIYQGSYAKALEWADKAIAVGLIAPEDLTEVASAMLFGPRYAEAEPLFKQALDMRRKLLGEEHADVATSLNNLASLYDFQGRHNEAEPLFKQALDMRRKLLGEEHTDVAISLHNLAALYNSQSRYDQAEPLFKEALAVNRKLLGEEHLETIVSLNDLAALYHAQGRNDEAEPLFRQVLGAYRKLHGEENPYVASGLNNMAVLYLAQRRYTEAEPLFKQALAVRKKLFGEEHPTIASSLSTLASLYKLQGRYAEAEPLFKQALAMHRKLLGEQHPHVAAILNNLAGVYDIQGRYGEAEVLYEQSLAIIQKLLGEQHPNVIKVQGNLQAVRKMMKGEKSESAASQ